MWPFRRRPVPAPPEPVTRDGVTASFERGGHPRWSWTLRGTAFSIDGDVLPADWIEASRRALQTLEALGPEIRIVVLRHLQGWGPPDAAVYSVRLAPELAPDGFEVVAEADAWGDLGVSIEIANGRINGHWAGD